MLAVFPVVPQITPSFPAPALSPRSSATSLVPALTPSAPGPSPTAVASSALVETDPAPSAVAAVTTVHAPVAPVPPSRTNGNDAGSTVLPTPAPQPSPLISEAPPRAPSRPPEGMVRTASGRFVRGRVTGDELITSLFESMHDLPFLRDALDGGQFCLALATEMLPARAALIHFFDLGTREWVTASSRGKDTTSLLALRFAENDEMLVAAARKRRALVVPNASDATQTERYRHLGGSRSLIIAPVMQAGRALGAIEIINPLDGMPFTDDEGNAMTYIAEQYAEYLGSRGIVLNRERIAAADTR